MKPKLLVLLFPILIASGCNFLNPIKELSCNTIKQKGSGVPKELSFIMNKGTGEYYEIDDFTNKLIALDGTTEFEGDKYDTRTNLTSDEWKVEWITKFAPRQPVPYVDAKDTMVLNLKTMKYTRISFLRGQGDWNEIWSSEGVCKWKNPNTTEILKTK
jgi:hypothetical protein